MRIRAKKSLGQNFLRDETVVERIVAALDLSADDNIIEIGPGTGSLTRRLAGRAERVIAVEFDRDLIPPLIGAFGHSPGFELINGDALQLDLSRLGAGPFKIVGNLPYNVATPILQHLAEQRDRIELLVLMFQREVVERITSKAGGKERGYLSVLSQNAFNVERLFDVPPAAFSPVPKVWSSVVRLVPRPILVEEAAFLALVGSAFSQRRKTLHNNLKGTVPDAAGLIMFSGIDPSRRAETLTLEEWLALFAAVKKAGTP